MAEIAWPADRRLPLAQRHPQLKTIGHPILGDDLYAPERVLKMADRLMLHAHKLTITHPQTASLMTFEAVCGY